MSDNTLTDPAKLLLLAALLANDHIISNNAKTFLKDVILRRDDELTSVLQKFEAKVTKDTNFLEEIHEIIKKEAEITYEDLFIDSSIEVGKSLSKRERDAKQLQMEKSLIYGEVEFRAFYDVLRTINPQPGLVFYDLGSGTGKAVMVARLTQDFSKCIGVEILDGLFNQSAFITDRYNDEYRSQLYPGGQQDVEMLHGSFLDVDWSDGDVVFANSTCFEDDLMSQLTDAAIKLKPGSIVVTFTKGINSKAFELVDKRRHKMSWGPATVFIHRRLGYNGKPVGPVRLNRLPGDRDYNGDIYDDLDNSGPVLSTDVDSSDSNDDNSSQGELNVNANDDMDVDDKYRSDSPPAQTRDRYGMDIIGSPQDTALMRRKKIQHDAAQDRSSSPPAPTKDARGMDIIGSPQDAALLRRKKMSHDTKPPPAPAFDASPARDPRDVMSLLGSPQDTALMRRKRVVRDISDDSDIPPAPQTSARSSSPPPASRDSYGNDIMSSPQGTALMRRKRSTQ